MRWLGRKLELASSAEAAADPLFRNDGFDHVDRVIVGAPETTSLRLSKVGLGRTKTGEVTTVEVPAIAPRCTISDMLGLDERDLYARLGQFARGIETGEARPDYGDFEIS